jgi:hypothetical protein
MTTRMTIQTMDMGRELVCMWTLMKHHGSLCRTALCVIMIVDEVDRVAVAAITTTATRTTQRQQRWLEISVQ